jgi:hypothetical protein
MIAVTALTTLAATLSVAACGSTTGEFLLTCSTEGARNVQGGPISSTISGTLDTSQNDVGTCETADAVVRGVTASAAEKPVTIDGFRCTPSVVSTGPDVVRWSCNFKGADTDTDVTLRFEATYRG